MFDSPEQSPRIDYLDGLRAAAILLVVVRHVVLFAPSIASGWGLHALEEGSHGVDLFFVISGFCLSYPVILRIRQHGTANFDVIRFLAKRIVRILPPYWGAVITISFLAVALNASSIYLSPTSMMLPTAWKTFEQFFFLDRSSDFINPSFWTLAVEFRWYLLFPLALWLWTANKRVFWVILFACVLLYQFTLAGGLDAGTLPGFLLGIVAAQAEVDRHALRKWAPAVLPFAVLAALALEPTRGDAWLGQDQFGWQIVAFLIVVSVGQYSTLRKMFALPPLRGLGLISYSVYLYHQPLLGVFMVTLGWNPLVATAAMLGVSVVFWFIFERTVLLPSVRDPLVTAISRPLHRVADLLNVQPSVVLPQRSRLDETTLAVEHTESLLARAD